MKDLKKRAAALHDPLYMVAVLAVNIAVFYLLVYLIMNPQVKSAMERIDYSIPIWMAAFIGILILFSGFFYHYLSQYCMEQKQKDFEVLYSLGYSKQLMKQSVCRDLLLFTIKSLLIGSIIGHLLRSFVEHFFLYQSGAYIFGADLFVISTYLVIYGWNLCVVLRSFKQCNYRNQRGYQSNHPDASVHTVWGGILLSCLGIFFLFANRYQKSYNFFSALLPMICFVVSSYYIVKAYPQYFRRFISRDKNRIPGNFFYISQLRLHYNKYSRLLVSCATLLFLSAYLIVNEIKLFQEDSHAFEKPYDYCMKVEDYNQISSELDSFEEKYAANLIASYRIHLTKAQFGEEDSGPDSEILLMPEHDYRLLTGKQLHLTNHDIVVLTQLDRSVYHLGIDVENGVEWGFTPPGDITYRLQNKNYHGVVRNELWEVVFNLNNQYQRTLILTDQDYDRIVEKKDCRSGIFLVKAKAQAPTEELQQALTKMTDSLEAKTDSLKQRIQYRNLVLLITFLMILSLFSCLISLLLLRTAQVMKEEHRDYVQLYMNGFSVDRINQERKKQLRTFFFLPYAVGSISSILYLILSEISLSLLSVILVMVVIGIMFLVLSLGYCITFDKIQLKNIR